MTATADYIETVRIEKERDKYGRTAYIYTGYSAEWIGRESAAIVRLPKVAHEKEFLTEGVTSPMYGKPYMVNTDRLHGHAHHNREHIRYVRTLREARAIVQALPWVQNAATVQDHQ